jgi:hypothetical protein
MSHGTETVARIYNAQQSLRGRCFELVHEGRDPNVTRLLEDLTDQHARQASELAVLLSDIGARTGPLPDTNAVSGDEAPAPPSLPQTLDRTIANILPGLIEAESGLLEAYDAAIARQEAGSPFLSLLNRHRVALATSLRRIEAIDR